MTKRIVIFIFLIFILPALIYAAVTDYLILEDIGSYKLFTGVTGRVFSGPPSKYSQTSTGGITEAAGHFSESDVTYSASYTESGSKWPFVDIAVTQHAGTDSDKWLLHEVERGFRFGDYEEDMTPSRFKTIDGNNIFYTKLGGGTYRWLSNNVVISIQYTDLYQQKTEPLEVIIAYLTKFPSTIAMMTIDQTHNEQWIKDEMERRLWLCDKWEEQFAAGKVDIKEVVRELHDHMKVFLNYKKKYYGIDTDSEKNAIYGYMQSKDEAAMKNKLTEYKSWWSANKDKAINL